MKRPVERIEYLENQIKDLEDRLYDALRVNNELWEIQRRHNEVMRKSAQALHVVEEKMQNQINASNNDQDDAWFILDQLIKQFKLKVPKKPKA